MKSEEKVIESSEESFLREPFDLRRFVLLAGRRSWIVLPVMLAGAVLFGLFCFVKQEVFGPDPFYRCDSLYHIDFAGGQEEEAQAWFNDYTWNDIVDSDVIAGVAATILDDIDKQYIADATFVPTMTDIHLFHIYVDDPDAEKAEKIRDALEITLASFSFRRGDIDDISSWKRGDAELVTHTSTLLRWVIAGAVVGLLIGLAMLAGHYILDDTVRLEKDVEKAGARCLGVVLLGKKDEKEEKRLKEQLAAELEGVSQLRIVDPAGTAISEKSAGYIRSLIPGSIKLNTGDAGAKTLLCVEAGSITASELHRQLAGKDEAAILCDAKPGLHYAYYFYGKRKEKRS